MEPSTGADMPQTPHVEKHFTAGSTVRDIVIGMSDGLTVPFALAAGLSGAVATTAVIVTAGLAEIAAGSIAMGLGGYLSAKSDAGRFPGTTPPRSGLQTMPIGGLAAAAAVLTARLVGT